MARLSTRSGGGGDARRRSARRYLMGGLSLVVLLLLPWESTMQGATAVRPTATTSAATSAAAHGPATADVVMRSSLSLARDRVSSHARTRVEVVVPGHHGSMVRTARQIGVVVQGEGVRHVVPARVVGGRVVATLPRLVVGFYRVWVSAASGTGPARADARPLSVVRPRSVAARPFPGPGNTGVPEGVRLRPYRGPCTITRDHTVIKKKVVGCDLVIRARHVVIKKSSVQTVLMDQDLMHARGASGWSFRIVDSTVDGGTNDGPGVCCGNYRVVRVEMKGGHNGAQCENGGGYCTVIDSWIHAQYEPAGGLRHLGGFLNDGGTPSTLVHNRITCDAPAQNDEGGCTGDINLIPNFGPMANVLVQRNYLGANANSAFCTYGGAAPGDEGFAARSQRIVYLDNAFERTDTVNDPAPGQPGRTSRCAAYGPVTGYDKSGPGNVWKGNHFTDGDRIRCHRGHRCK